MPLRLQIRDGLTVAFQGCTNLTLKPRIWAPRATLPFMMPPAICRTWPCASMRPTPPKYCRWRTRTIRETIRPAADVQRQAFRDGRVSGAAAVLWCQSCCPCALGKYMRCHRWRPWAELLTGVPGVQPTPADSVQLTSADKGKASEPRRRWQEIKTNGCYIDKVCCALLTRVRSATSEVIDMPPVCP